MPIKQFQETLKEHPRTEASDKIQFDSGAAAYKMKEYGKALESFSQALLSRDAGLQGSSHYNLGNTLYQRGDAQKADDKKLTDWNNALQHYDETLKLNPQNKEAKENRDFVQRKIDELKKKQEQQPTRRRRHPRRRNRTRTRRNKTSRRTNKKIRRRSPRIKRIRKINRRTTREVATNKNPRRKRINLKARIAAKIPAPAKIKRNNQNLAKPPPLHLAKVLRLHPERRLLPRRKGAPLLRLRKNQAGIPIKQKSNHHLENPPLQAGTGASPTPSPGEGNESGAGAGESPTPGPTESPSKKPTGEVKGANGETPNSSPEPEAQAEEVKEGEMSEKQAERLLQSMKDEERRVQLDERKAVRHVYKDW